jgi:hypothetical protein
MRLVTLLKHTFNNAPPPPSKHADDVPSIEANKMGGPGKSMALLSAFRNGLSARMLMLCFPLQCYVSVL